jgi:hypothetical protein
MITLLFGWWSFFGLFWTIEALITNLSGGRDATDELLAATRGGNVALAQQAIDEEVRARRRESIRAVLQLVGIVGGVALLLWATVTITDWSMKRSPTQAIAAKQVQLKPAIRAVSDPAVSPTHLTAPMGSRKALRLQAIFYNANGHSTAIINGKTVSIGEAAGGWTVLGIERELVSVQSANGEKLVLQLANVGR